MVKEYTDEEVNLIDLVKKHTFNKSGPTGREKSQKFDFATKSFDISIAEFCKNLSTELRKPEGKFDGKLTAKEISGYIQQFCRAWGLKKESGSSFKITDSGKAFLSEYNQVPPAEPLEPEKKEDKKEDKKRSQS